MEKVSLPIKTKIAAWWMIIFGIIFSGYQFSILYSSYKLVREYDGFGFSPLSVGMPTVLFTLLFCFLIGIFLLKRKKTAWNFAIAIFSIIFLGSLFSLFVTIFQKDFGSLDKFFSFLFLSTLIPVILLILDRKNFRKIAT